MGGDDWPLKELVRRHIVLDQEAQIDNALCHVFAPLQVAVGLVSSPRSLYTDVLPSRQMLHTLGHLSRTTTNFTKTRVASALMAPTIDHLRRASKLHTLAYRRSSSSQRSRRHLTVHHRRRMECHRGQ